MAMPLMLLTGCREEVGISTYQVLKEKIVNELNPGDQAKKPATDRLLAAIVPHGNAAWFFKLSGPIASVEPHAAAFEQLIQSVKFSDDATTPPTWTLPDGWQQTGGKTDFRVATLAPKNGPKIELTVTTLGWPADDDVRAVLANINRWRGQLGLRPLRLSDLATETRAIKLEKGEAIVVDYRGHQTSGGMTPPFAK